MSYWHDARAACLGVDVSVFYDLARRGNKEMAFALCGACQVRSACLEAAMKEEHGGQRFGIRGGLTAEERKRLMKKRARDAAAMAA